MCAWSSVQKMPYIVEKMETVEILTYAPTPNYMASQQAEEERVMMMKMMMTMKHFKNT